MRRITAKIDPKYQIEVIDDQVRIVKTSSGVPVPEDEPVMFFRARDRHAIATIEAYRSLCAADGCNEYHMAGIENRLQAFREFAAAQPEKMKQPGVTKGA